MPFKKGQSGNVAGRKLGSCNHTTSEIRSAVQRLMEDELPRLQRDLAKLPADERARILGSLMNYVLPKLSHTDATVRTLPTPIIYEKVDGTKVTLDAKESNDTAP